MTRSDRPLVSVVTPFYNTESYLAECIESVLAQSYGNFEYILSDNCSTDDSREIAESYARRDSRIRLVRQPTLLPQVPHYNKALTYISPESEFCKIVQADDSIFPECLDRMVRAFEQLPSIGLVSSFYIKGRKIFGGDYPAGRPVMPGRELARLFIREGVYVFGSPSTVMFRASMVRDQVPFYDEVFLHEDTEKCIQLLETHDFGFVYQVLSNLRVDNESISAADRRLEGVALDFYITARKYAPVFLDATESSFVRKSAKHNYYGMLARQALQMRGSEFWNYQKRGLKTINEKIDICYLLRSILMRVIWLVSNPGLIVRGCVRWFTKTD